MKRRNFLKFLGILPVAPKIAIDIMSKIPFKKPKITKNFSELLDPKFREVFKLAYKEDGPKKFY